MSQWSGGSVGTKAIVLQTESYALPARTESVMSQMVPGSGKIGRPGRSPVHSSTHSAFSFTNCSNCSGSRTMKSKRSLHLLNTHTCMQDCTRLYVFQGRIGRRQIPQFAFKVRTAGVKSLKWQLTYSSFLPQVSDYFKAPRCRTYKYFSNRLQCSARGEGSRRGAVIAIFYFISCKVPDNYIEAKLTVTAFCQAGGK